MLQKEEKKEERLWYREKHRVQIGGSGESISASYYVIERVVMSKVYYHQTICGLNFQCGHVLAGASRVKLWLVILLRAAMRFPSL